VGLRHGSWAFSLAQSLHPCSNPHKPYIFFLLPPCRNPGPHLAFGYGRHVCIAQWLARAEIEIALSTLLRRVPSLRLAGSEAEAVEFSPPTKDIGITKMQVTW
jgi:cytochrome P450